MHAVSGAQSRASCMVFSLSTHCRVTQGGQWFSTMVKVNWWRNPFFSCGKLALDIKKKMFGGESDEPRLKSVFWFWFEFQGFFVWKPSHNFVTGWLTFGCGHGQRHAGGLEENSLPVGCFRWLPRVCGSTLTGESLSIPAANFSWEAACRNFPLIGCDGSRWVVVDVCHDIKNGTPKKSGYF